MNEVPLSLLIKQSLESCLPRASPKKPHFYSKIKEAQLQPLLGRNIRTERIMRCLSPEYVASKARMSRTRLMHIEEGNKVPTLEQFIGICDALGVLPHLLVRHMLRVKTLSKEPKGEVYPSH